MQRFLNKAVIACSGGLDSVVLVDLLAREPLKLLVCYIDHGQRTKREIARDIRAVKLVCKRHELKLIIAKLPLKKGASESEMRKARYAKLKDLALGSPVFTAHHADDQLETYLFRLIRGTHPTSIRAISAKSSLNGLTLFRPLLKFTKKDLEDYAKARKLAWSEDASNQSRRYARNRIRHELIPLLNSLRPGASKRILDFFNALAVDKPHQTASVNQLADPEFFRTLDFATFKHILVGELGEWNARTTRAHWLALKKQWDARKASKRGGGPKKIVEFPGGNKAVFLGSRFIWTKTL